MDRREALSLGLAAAAGTFLTCGPRAASRAPAPAASAPPAKIDIPPPVPPATYARRRQQLSDRMRQEGIDALLLTPSPALLYLTGADLWRSERLIATVLRPDGSCDSLGPAFEADRLKGSGLPGSLLTWEESEDPVPRLARLLAASGAALKLAVEGTTWYDDLAPLSRSLPSARLLSASPLISPLRMKKEPEEIALIRCAGRITLAIIARLMKEMADGVTEKEVLRRGEEIARTWDVPLDGMVQFGANSAIPHAASGDTKLREGDVVLFDLGVTVHGYHSDVSRTFAFGRPPGRFQEVYGIVRSAQDAGFRAARDGAPAQTVDEAARSVIRRAGFARQFTHRLGHGLGLQVHEPPYLVEGNPTLLAEGMTVTVEPGIYLPGLFGVRLEDDVRVAAGGGQILSSESEGPPAGGPPEAG